MNVVSFGNTRQVITKQVVELLNRARVDLSDEKRTQRDIAEIFEKMGIKAEREVKLTKADIVDFMVGEVAIEVKLKGSRKMDVYRQLMRYAESPRVGAIILATNLTMGLPPELSGKPVYFVSLGKAWL